jgi:hypothetical protein
MTSTAAKLSTATPAPQPLDEFDALVLNAARGDRRAIGALAVGYGPTLLKQAREALGRSRVQQDEDLLQDLFVGMTQASFNFVPGRDQGPAWLQTQLRILAGASRTDLIVARATDGDVEAVAQVIEMFSDMMIEEARSVLGESLAHDPEDVVQALAEQMVEGCLTFGKGRRGAIRYLRRKVRAIARRMKKGERLEDV